MSSGVERKLTTILAADAEGYSRVMDADEVRALGALQAARSVFSKFIDRHHGRIVNTAGDGLIAEFPRSSRPSGARSRCSASLVAVAARPEAHCASGSASIWAT